MSAHAARAESRRRSAGVAERVAHPSQHRKAAPRPGVEGHRASAHPAVTTGLLLHGVDFSGAESGGAAKIRVVTRDLGDPRQPIALEGRFDRRGLVRVITQSAADGRDHLWRIDAPMGLPAEMLPELQQPADWRTVAQWMHGCASPRLWRSAVREHTRREPRRGCDSAMATPMSPLNLRVFKQTWTLICEVLLPLAEAGIRIEPVLPGTNARVAVCEGCPASVLAAKGWPKRGYKGAGAPTAVVRADIVRLLRGAGMEIPNSLAEEAIRDGEGDLLDAIILVSAPFQTVVPRIALVEGWVY